MIGKRPFWLVARNVGRRENYEAMARMPSAYAHPATGAWRYITGRGDYPTSWALRTPLGSVAPTLYTHHDLVTVTEVFCRLDYRAPADVGAVVDIGSNIGISALYFLTRNRASRCYLYEPVRRNVARLRANLAAFTDRFELTEAAVWDREGAVRFGLEPTGRYGGIDVDGPEAIEVPCREINDVLEAVLEKERTIDVLKVDTEGAEVATIRSIRPELLARIRLIYLETMDRPVLHPALLESHFACDTLRLSHRGPLDQATPA